MPRKKTIRQTGNHQKKGNGSRTATYGKNTVKKPDTAKIRTKELKKPSPRVKTPLLSLPSPVNLQKIHKKLVIGLQDYVKTSGLNKVVVGLSGGIDSALTLKIAIDALGAGNIAALILPELGVSSEENINHAKALAAFFKVKTYYQPINALQADFGLTPWKPNKHAGMNTKSRIRSVLLYSYANTKNALVLGTSNKSEILLGYGTKYGDLAADIEVIGSLYKTEVYALAEHLHLPQEIIDKAPTAELEAGQTDEQDLGAPYAILDTILNHLSSGETTKSIVKMGFSLGLVETVIKRMETNAHKNEMPPVLEIL